MPFWNEWKIEIIISIVLLLYVPVFMIWDPFTELQDRQAFRTTRTSLEKIITLEKESYKETGKFLNWDEISDKDSSIFEPNTFIVHEDYILINYQLIRNGFSTLGARYWNQEPRWQIFCSSENDLC